MPSTTTDHQTPAYGSAEHAAGVTDGRFPGIRDGLQWLTYAHLPEQLRAYSRPFYRAACSILLECPTDSPELTTAINALITAKDSAMRAGIRNDTGRAGSVPRPQAVVAPPALSEDEGSKVPRLGCSHGFVWGGIHGHVCDELPSDGPSRVVS